PFLIHLHQATIESEESGLALHQVLEREIDPAVKDLASCLLYPQGSRTELDECIAKFEAALDRLRATYGQLHTRTGHIRKLQEQSPRECPSADRGYVRELGLCWNRHPAPGGREEAQPLMHPREKIGEIFVRLKVPPPPEVERVLEALRRRS